MSDVLAMVISVLGSGVLCILFTAVLLPVLRKAGAGQNILADAPQSHAKKAGTPTMGGIAIIFAALIPFYFLAEHDVQMWLVCLAMLSYGAIGYCDDVKKISGGTNKGFSAFEKLLLQIIAAVVLAFFASRMGSHIYIPFVGEYRELGKLYIPFVALVFVATSNAVNLTDGLDGLASGVTASVSLTLLAVCAKTGVRSGVVFAACLAGACVGFLAFNKNPAKIFMGDTGSLALGGALAAVSAVCGMEFILIIAGGVFVAEALSVIIQVVVFKLTGGKRVFRMTPLHHHFELGGWKEKKVVRVFVLVSVILGAAAFVLV